MCSESVHARVFAFNNVVSVWVYTQVFSCEAVEMWGMRVFLEWICGKWLGIHTRGFECLAVNVFQGDD